MLAQCNQPIWWTGCYQGTYALIAPEAYAHPAKMAPGLCFRILDHLNELGLLKEGDRILDPMAGTGLTAICANAKGYSSVTVELEGKFIGFENQNKEYAERRLYKKLDWQIIKGDARRLSELLQERGLVTVSSPPYAANQDLGGGIDWEKAGRPDRLKPSEKRHNVYGLNPGGYGQSDGQLGNLPDRPLKSVMSPPYDAQGHPSLGSVNKDRWGNNGHDRVKRRGLDGTCAIIGQTYVSAMLQVYEEIAKVSDVLAIVIKNPTRNGKLRRLDLDTIKLLEMSGWKIHCQHRALLFTDLETTNLFGETKKKVKGRLSFFKRLSYQKGQPVAAWEDILIAVRSQGEA